MKWKEKRGVKDCIKGAAVKTNGYSNIVDVSFNVYIGNGDLARITTNRKYRAPGKHSITK